MTTNTANITYYTVRSGDTLTSIGVIFGTTVEQLVEWNNLPDPDLIRVGQRLIVTRASSSHDSYYIVRSGDTLTSIADMFGTTIDQLVRWNGIPDPDLIKVDQRLIVAKSVPMAA
ncbi:LysM peptidoglycan-binding domain-containing protein [Kitasatospora sp. NBC_00240]|uniref:LysM peptidoglycan-binding domain-containing protein n=1 Tax=Kitasatospora sp. NBC_00240 TaxID=2903567 RepID=UPI00224E1C34|nr:LysM peptidoglycan-binding domain-containing protein [Kitasatospora sp. NBC_00240]MCX5214565.1 LysM peptidoglycan-binding domain-containing protein [Kitasatospora sp. NBC_00240]